jgi:hypothetical protein
VPTASKIPVFQDSQGFMVRIAALLLLIGGALAAGPAAAQFNIFGNSSPPQPPPVQYPAYPDQTQPPQYQPPQYQQPQYQPQSSRMAPSQSAIQSQPLAPPPGAVAAPQPAVPAQSNLASPPAPAGATRGLPAPANAAPPQSADASTQPEETEVVETPTQHIDNGRAVFAGLDKITGRTIKFDAAIGETVQFGALQVTPRACYTRPPTEPTNTDAFVEVDEVTLQGEIKRIFTGWMFASSPGLHAVEHPIYDVWLTDCASPSPNSVAQNAAPSVPAPADASPPAPSRLRRSIAPAAAPNPSFAPR